MFKNAVPFVREYDMPIGGEFYKIRRLTQKDRQFLTEYVVKNLKSPVTLLKEDAYETAGSDKALAEKLIEKHFSEAVRERNETWPPQVGSMRWIEFFISSIDHEQKLLHMALRHFQPHLKEEDVRGLIDASYEDEEIRAEIGAIYVCFVRGQREGEPDPKSIWRAIEDSGNLLEEIMSNFSASEPPESKSTDLSPNATDGDGIKSENSTIASLNAGAKLTTDPAAFPLELDEFLPVE